MSRKQNPNRKKAFKIWKDSGAVMKPKEIAEKLGITPESVRKWKSLDQWEGKIANAKPGAPRGNQNAKGNRGGKGGPLGNQKAVTHGLFRKFEPQDPEYLELIDIVQQMEPIDMIWHNITQGFRKIIWAQRIFFIKDKEDMTKELKKRNQVSMEMNMNGKFNSLGINTLVSLKQRPRSCARLGEPSNNSLILHRRKMNAD